MTFALQLLVSGVAMGSIYALVALGYNITFASAKAVNFGQGELVMLGSMVFFTAAYGWGVPFLWALLLTVGAEAALGAAVERVAVAPANRRNPHAHLWIMSTIGLGIVLQNLAMLIWGKDPFPVRGLSIGGRTTIRVGDVAIGSHEVWVFALGAAAILAVDLLYERTRVGRAMKAVAFDNETARLMGIDAALYMIGGFALSAMLAGLAGVLLAPLTFASVYIGLITGLKGFAAAVMGGLGHNKGAVLGGLTVGLIEAMARGVLASGYQNVITFALLTLVLVARPGGLLGRRAASRA